MHTITVLGLGAGQLDQISIGVYRQIKTAKHIIARTNQHPVLDELCIEGVEIESFDSIYEACDDFSDVYTAIVQELIRRAENEPITYVVPGHPLVAEQTVQLLIEQEKQGYVQLNIQGGNSFLDPVFAALRIDPIEGFQLVDGTALKLDDIQMTQHVLIGQVYDAFSASEVKLTLLEKYAYNYPVTIVTAAGSKDEQVRTVPLVELDRVMTLTNLTTVYVPPVTNREERLKDWTTFREIIATLRGPNGCPWDREQTHASLKRYLIEEAHELVQAIEEEDDNGIIEELGDVLLQVFLHAQIGEDEGFFSLEDVIEAVNAKMIRRHPHVFGDTSVDDADDVIMNWQQIKEAEKPLVQSILEGQDRASSSLLTSYNYLKAAARVGFDWSNIQGAFKKFEEEWEEFRHEVLHGNRERQIDELGDVLFTLVNIARFLKLSPEEAMVHANQKFKKRFSFVEQSVLAEAGTFDAYNGEQLSDLWLRAKRKEDKK